ncbi:protease HtpX [Hahella sp. SMD15-11]|uniref:Protease HtpX n=1 Tax=Thermohahella caldifontis TaxID=3142973 RepID=A0AB39UZI9_9GAMM
MKRIVLFLATNLAVLLVASVTLKALGVERYLAQQGIPYEGLLMLAAVFGMTGSIISLLMSKTMARISTGTQIIETPRTPMEQWLVGTVAQLAREAGIGMPEVGIFPARQANAFATGWNKDNALVAVSSGLLERYSQDEIRAILGHEIGHVANGDMVTLALLQGVLNTFVIFFARIIGTVVDQALFRRNDSESPGWGYGPGYYIVSIIAELVLGILASLIVMWFSRQREFRADAAGAQLAGAGAMIAALRHLQAETSLPDEMPETLTAFAINEGFKQGMARLFSTHPPLEERIQALQARLYG